MSHEEEHPEMGVDLMALAFKVMESAYIIRDNIYTVKGDYRKIRPKDKDKLLYILISYVGEFLALLGAGAIIHEVKKRPPKNTSRKDERNVDHFI